MALYNHGLIFTFRGIGCLLLRFHCSTRTVGPDLLLLLMLLKPEEILGELDKFVAAGGV